MWFSKDFFNILQKNNRTQSDNDLLEQTLDSVKNKINSCVNVQKLPETRRKYIKGGSRTALYSWLFDGHSHCYIRADGTRSEIQPNIGVWADGKVRVGYGFELTKANFGNPEKCQKFLDATISLLKSKQDNTRFYVERSSRQDGFLAKYIESCELVDFLSQENSDWLFFGYVISVNDSQSTPSILTEIASLEFINKFFNNTLDFYNSVWQIYKSIP